MDSQTVLPMRIALTQQNLVEAEQLLMSRYLGNFSPSNSSISKVTNWLNTSGIAHKRVRRSHGGTQLLFDATVHEAEQLFQTTYYLYGNKNGAHGGCEEYSIPADVREYVDFITPTVNFDYRLRGRGFILQGERSSHKTKDLKHMRRDSVTFKPNATTACDQLVTPKCLRTLYHIPTSIKPHPNNSFGLIEFNWVTYRPDDLDLFFETFEPSMVGNRPRYDSIDGGMMQTFANFSTVNDEADLDLEYAMALAYPLNVTNIQMGDLLTMGSMNNFLAAIDKTYCGSLDSTFDTIYPDLVPATPPYPAGYNKSDCSNHEFPKVIAISYAHDEIAFTPAYERLQCLEYLKLGLQGTTVIFASADSGAASQEGTCQASDTGFNSSISRNAWGSFNPTFPSTCPYITSVGGTQLPTKSSRFASSSAQVAEAAFETTIPTASQNKTSSIIRSSGGGFSNVFHSPYYQTNAVRKYLQLEASSLLNISMKFNSSGRAFPDVSTNAASHVTAVDGGFRKIYGTSASAPVFGAIIAKINDVRLSAGKETVGFINPVLYSHPEVTNDVVGGMNYGFDNKPAFRTAKGWDPVTGLGTPDFERMLDLFMSLP